MLATLLIWYQLTPTIVQPDLPPYRGYYTHYLVAPIEEVEFVPPKTALDKEMLDQAKEDYLRFQLVRVIDRKGPNVKFHSEDNVMIGWVEEKYVIPFSAFKEIAQWNGLYRFWLCFEYWGCHDFAIEPTGRFQWKHAPLPGEDCEFMPKPEGNWQDWGDWEEHGWDGEYICEAEGRIEQYQDYLRFYSRWDIFREVIFQISDNGRLCWVYTLEKYDICMPLDPVLLNIGNNQ